MLLVKATLDAIMAAIAATTILGSAAAAAKKVLLFQNNLDPDTTTLLADLTEADFDGYGQIDLKESVAYDTVDALSGKRQVLVLEEDPLHWIVTGTANLPQTIYGYAVLNSAGTAIVGIERFAAPVTVTGVDQSIDVPLIRTQLEPASFN